MAKSRIYKNPIPTSTSATPKVDLASKQAIDALSEARTLLYTLHVRNKNQHRRSHWYRHFNTFRREIVKLCTLLGVGFKGVATLNASPGRTEDAHARLSYWRTANLPIKWYEAFTHLVATTQFASLGVVLLGILAKVTTALKVQNAS